MLGTLSVSPLMGYVSYLCCVFKNNSLLVDFVFDDLDKVCVIVYCTLMSHSKLFVSLVQSTYGAGRTSKQFLELLWVIA